MIQNLEINAAIPVLLLLPAVLAGVALWQRRQIKKLRHLLLAREELETVNRECMVADGLYDNILEADITRNQLIGTNCVQLTALLGIPITTSFSQCIDVITEKMVNREYHTLYRECFDRQGLLRKFESGERKLTIEFIEKPDLIQECWTRATICLYYSKVSKTVKIISYVSNIQQEKQRELRLQQQINTDYLTGLFNKRATEERIRELLSKKVGIPRRHALLMIDIDRFKQVNDTVGHIGGDHALCIVARLLEKHFGPDGIIGRIGGDEFLVLLKDYSTVDSVKERVSQLINHVTARETATRAGTPLSLSIGLALYPEHGLNYPSLFEAADHALYSVKKHTRNGYCLYDKAVPRPLS